MPQNKLGSRVKARLGVAARRAVLRVEGCEHRAVVRRARHDAVFLENEEKAARSACDDVQKVLVLPVMYKCGVQTLRFVSSRLGREDAGVELPLEDLVGEVDAELLERIPLHNLKTKDIQNAHERQHGSVLQTARMLAVQLAQQPVEERCVEELYKSGGVVVGRRGRKGNGEKRTARRRLCKRDELRLEQERLDAQKPRHLGIVTYDHAARRPLADFFAKLQSAEAQQRRQSAAHGVALFRRDAAGLEAAHGFAEFHVV
mmetsp:Transcript_27553/g.94804  ORF Transcript_27553/g.94804 Transcript_27553/m.94804 type:complete len:259 (-) Transcript_27553:25-801(-)